VLIVWKKLQEAQEALAAPGKNRQLTACKKFISSLLTLMI
jgi:hypothetical protein